jgi:hypothetical protein
MSLMPIEIRRSGAPTARIPERAIHPRTAAALAPAPREGVRVSRARRRRRSGREPSDQVVLVGMDDLDVGELARLQLPAVVDAHDAVGLRASAFERATAPYASTPSTMTC